MSHEEYQGLLLRYFYQELEGVEKEEFEAHLYQCQICQQELAGLSELSSQLESLEELKPGSGVHRSIKKQARGVMKKSLWERIFSPRVQLRWAGGLVLAVIIFSVVAFMVWRLVGRSEQEAYSFWKLGENLEVISEESQVLVRGFPESLEAEIFEEDEKSPAYFNGSPVSISQLELELEEIELLAEGIFEI